jgi:hypothetical protein
MPNWCGNELTCYGPTDDVDAIVDLFEAGEPFEALVPQPEGEDWYTWRIHNWGTKWDIGSDDVTIDIDPCGTHTYAKLYFDTAWSPPEGVLDALREKFPNVDFTLFYREDGMQLAGYL